MEFTSEAGYNIGFIPETTMLKANQAWQASIGDNRSSLQFACASLIKVNETYE